MKFSTRVLPFVKLCLSCLLCWPGSPSNRSQLLVGVYWGQHGCLWWCAKLKVCDYMSAAMDKALMAMSLEEEEEDIPFEMPDLPEFMSKERNAISLIGRTLNLECQSMKNLIRDMPRKCQKPGRMKGVALSSERFQFIFNTEHDLQEVLIDGMKTHPLITYSLFRYGFRFGIS